MDKYKICILGAELDIDKLMSVCSDYKVSWLHRIGDLYSISDGVVKFGPLGRTYKESLVEFNSVDEELLSFLTYFDQLLTDKVSLGINDIQAWAF